MRIKGTFLDEISHDIPHQNWGEAEWDRDFGYMREAGIDTVILIRCGYRRWQTFPSRVLTAEEGCYEPPVDLVDMFLRLSDKWGMNFWFGLYDSGKYWDRGEYEQEVALNKRVIDEVWSRYGHYKSFAGWYISQECSRNTGRIVDLYASLGRYCKEVSGGLPTMISPYIDGSKNVSQYNASTSKQNVVTLESHEREWDAIFAGIKGAVDIVAFPERISSCALLSHTSVPWDNPEIRTRSEKFFGFVSRSICMTNSVPNSGMPRLPRSHPISSSGVTFSAEVSANNDNTSWLSREMVFASSPVRSSSIRIIVGSSCPSISSFSRLWSMEW